MVWLAAALGIVLAYVLYLATRGARKRPEAVVSHAPRPRKPAGQQASAPAWGKRLLIDPATACRPARQLAGQGFPLDRLPHLPMEGCDCATCLCQLEALQDRRSGNERRSGQERREQFRFEEKVDRRQGKDRRKDSHFTWHTTI